MSTKTKKKLCWNCESNVDIKAEKCPSCGVSTDVNPILGTQPKGKSPLKPSTHIPASPYQFQDQNLTENTSESANSSEFQSIGLALSFLLLGTVLSIFSFVLYLFSDAQGILTLQWHATYWYIYLLLALPMLYFGWSYASNLSADEETTSS